MRILYGSTRPEAVIELNSENRIALPLPCLSRLDEEQLLPDIQEFRESEAFVLGHHSGLHFGIAAVKLPEAGCAEVAEALYKALFELTAGLHLYRIWNFLPGINQGEGDLERYRQFSLGRANAFLNAFGQESARFMPSGTCVGAEGTQLILYFLAGDTPPDHHENTQQVPAYRYPREYGRRSPSFARATTVTVGDSHYRFISGTAAILGHRSRGLNDLSRQLEITCDNLETILRESTSPTPSQDPATTSGKVYLRNANDYEAARAYLSRRFPGFADRLIYLQADICRKELLVEIELTVEEPGSA